MYKKKKRQPSNGAKENVATAPALTPGGLKIQDAGKYLGGLSKPSMYRLVERGLLKPNKALRVLLFAKADLDRFLSEI